jgi:HSP20 family molecular chaperone IbpA
MTTELDVKQADEAHGERTRSGRVYRPHVDIVERDDELTLLADMPGAKSEAIDIRFEDGLLTVQGAVEPRYGENWSFLLSEYGVGDFYRTFRLSEQIDSDGITAEYADGVLTLHLPKAKAAKPHKIEVHSGK